MLERLFKIKESGSSIGTEVLAGFTTFATMAYIIVANPAILHQAGMDIGAVTIATCLSAAIATLLMGLIANYPFALAPGMGINAFFTYAVCQGMGVPWQQALGMVFISGVLFLLLTISGVRETVVNAIPISLKSGVSCGIGLFLALIGLENAGLITAQPGTLVTINRIASPEVLPRVLLAFIGFMIMSALMVRNIKGAVLIGIIVAALIANFVPYFKLQPTLPHVSVDLSPTFLKFDVVSIVKGLNVTIVILIFTFLFIDFFDTMGTLIGLAQRTGVMKKDGTIPRVGRAMMADAIGTVVGAALGTSTVTSYIESAAGVESGGRTGLTACVVALLFGVATFATPLVKFVPSEAVAPALVIVGFLMMASLVNIDFKELSEAIPAFITIVVMAFTFNISSGLGIGFITYCLIKLLTGQGRQVHPVMYGLAAVFVLFFAFSPVFR